MKTEGEVQPNGVAYQKPKSETFFGWHTIWGKDGEVRSPMQTRGWIGRLRLHIFWRGDNDPDCHDHPWPFWTFPFHSYLEEYITWDPGEPDTMQGRLVRRRNVVRRFRWHYRPATYTHRVIGRWPGDWHFHPETHVAPEPRVIVTIVWRGKKERSWGFLKNRDGKWCWIAWKEYVYGDGKSAPCE